MVNVIWTGDTLAIVWFWQVSNLMHAPFSVPASPERKLITFDTLHMLCCSDKPLLFAGLLLFSMSTIRQQLNKQGAVFSIRLHTDRVKCCQMTRLNSRMSHCVNIFDIAASACSPFFYEYSSGTHASQMSNGFCINNQKHTRKHLQCPWKMAPSGNVWRVQGFPDSVLFIGTLELLLTSICSPDFSWNHSALSFRLAAGCLSVHIRKAYYGLL